MRSSFLGGVWSQSMQGRTDRPDYPTALNDCINAVPIETGAMVRRSGTRFAQTTRSGAAGRVIKFDFSAANPYTMEFTDGHLRFFAGLTLVNNAEAITVTSISTATPAVVTGGTHPFQTGDQVFFSGLGTNAPTIQNRVFSITRISTTTYSLQDAVTGQNIVGTGIGSVGASATASSITDIATPYVGSLWQSLRSVQTEKTSFLLQGDTMPYALTVATDPTDTSFATFALNPAVFNDGPYDDPFVNGVQANPSAKSGIVNITLNFPAYVATQAYAKDAFVTFGGNNYTSLVDQNVNNQPDTHPAQWAAVSAGQAISPDGFQGSDVGRLVRLFSEPDLWSSTTTYAANAVVSYNPSGLPGQVTYWSSLTGSNLNFIPGTDTNHWQLMQQGGLNSPAIWTWGKITGLLNLISPSLAGSVNIGTMTANGGLAAAFDTNLEQASGACAARNVTTIGGIGANATVSTSSYVGKNYTTPGAQRIEHATVYPSTNKGFLDGSYIFDQGGGNFASANFSSTSVRLNLRAKATAPASSSDGTLLGTTGNIADTTTPVSVTSSDTTTTWNFVWIEIIVSGTVGSLGGTQFTLNAYICEAQFFAPAGASTGSGVSVEILGPPLLYTTPIRTWRLGTFSNTTGWPTCGTYHEGRLWLSGVVPNRIDACVSNGIVGGTVNWAPTDLYGNVLNSSAMDYTFNAPDVNPMFWMIPDLQGIICGTKMGEWLVQAPSSGPITPFNIVARRVTAIGCANIEPRRTEHTTIFVQKFQRKVMEYFADVFSGKFTAPHLTERGKHLTAPAIAEIAYQQELAPIVWLRLTDGTLLGISYKRDTLSTASGPTFAGMHKHTLGSGRQVESITVGISAGGNLDALTMVTNDPATGVRHVEVMADLAEETSTLAAEWLLDDAVSPSSRTATGSNTTINGLWHLNGKTVTVYASGLDCGDFTVSNGSVTVPFGVAGGLFTSGFAATATYVIGFTYTSQAQLVRPSSREDTGARNGPAFGKLRRSHWYALELYNSTAGADGGIGTDYGKLDPIVLAADNGAPLTALQPFNAIKRATLRDTESLDSMLAWRVTRPRPWNVAAAGAFIEAQDL
jgi:hypothetical protein